jgi:hypothetical protein
MSSSTDTVNVRFGASIEDLVSKLRQIGEAVRETADTMVTEMRDRAGEAFGTVGSDAASGAQQAAGAVNQMAAQAAVATNVIAQTGAAATEHSANAGAALAGTSGVFGAFAERVRSTFDGVKGRMGDVGQAMRGLAEGATQELQQRAAGAFGSFGQQAVRALNDVQSKLVQLPPAFRVVAGGLLAIVGTIAAGMAGKKFSDDAAGMIESARDLARALGITTNEASVWQAVLADVGASQGEFEGAARGLSRQLRTNEDDLKRVGLATRDAAGNLRPMNALIIDAIKLLGTYKEGTDRNVASQMLFGRGIDASSRLMLINQGVVDENRKAVEELGLMVGKNMTDAYEEYDAATDDAARKTKAFGLGIGVAVMPVLTELTEWLSSAFPIAKTIAVGAISGLATAFLGLTNGVRVVWETINAMVVTVAEPIRALATSIFKAASGDFRGAANEIKGIGSTISGAWKTAMTEMTASSQATSDRISRIWGFMSGPDSTPGNTGAPAGTKTAPPTKPDKKTGDSKLAGAELGLARAEHEAALELEREYLAQAQVIYDQAYRDNLLSVGQYYDAKLAIEMRGIDASLEAKRRDLAEAKKAEAQARSQGAAAPAADRDKFETQAVRMKTEQVKLLGQIAVLEAQRSEAVRKTSSEYSEAERKVTDELTTIRANRAQATAEAEISEERNALQQMVALQQITAEETFAVQRSLEERSYAATQTFLQAKRDLIRGDNETALAQQFAEEETAHREHQRRLLEIERESQRERAQASLQVQQSVRGSFATMIGDLINGVTKVKDGFRNFAMSVTQTFVNLISQKFAEKIFDATGARQAVDKMVSFVTEGVAAIVQTFIGGEIKKTAVQQAQGNVRIGAQAIEKAAEKAGVLSGVAVTEGAEFAKSGAVITGAATRTAAEGTAAGASTGFTLGSAIANIGAKAWEAAASVYAAIAQIPIVGPFLAPAVAVGAAAMVLGFIGNIASSEGGEYQVDRDRLNIVHKDETILPAPFAQGLRELVGDGGMAPVVTAIDQIAQRLAPDGARPADPQALDDAQRPASLLAGTHGAEGARNAPTAAPDGAPVPADASTSLAPRAPPTGAPVAMAEPLPSTTVPLRPEAKPVPADEATSLVLAQPARGDTARPPHLRALEVAAAGEQTTPAPEREAAKSLAAAELSTKVNLQAVSQPSTPASAERADDVGRLVMNWQADEERDKPLSESKLALGRLQSIDAGQPAERSWWRVPSSPLARIQSHAAESSSGSGATLQGDGRRSEAPIHIHGKPDDTIKLRDLATVLKSMGRDFRFGA